MKILNKLFLKTPSVIDFGQEASVIFYPNRILCETQNKSKSGFWVRTDNVTFLNIDATDYQLGETLKKHLNSSIYTEQPMSEIKQLQEKYKKVTGLKSIKEQMKDSLLLTVHRDNANLTLTPTINGGTSGDDKGYSYLNKENIVLDSNIGSADLGIAIRLGWTKCRLK